MNQKKHTYLRMCCGLSLIALFSFYVWGAVFCVHTHIMPDGLTKHAHPYSTPSHSHTSAELSFIDAVMSFQCDDYITTVPEIYHPILISVLHEEFLAELPFISVSFQQLRAPPVEYSQAA